MPTITYDEDGNPVTNTAPSPVPPLGETLPQSAPEQAPVFTPAAPMNPEDAELLQEAAAMPPVTAPVPNAADTRQMVTNLTTNGVATDPTLNFKPKRAARPSQPNDLTALDASKAETDKTALENQAAVTEEAKAHADTEDENARNQSLNSAMEAQDRADFNQKWNDNHDKLENHYKEIESKYLQALDDNQHPKDFFTGKSTLQKFGAIFGMALGSLGGATPGGNAAVESMNRQMDAEHTRQRETIEGLDHATLRALTHISDSNAARQVAQTDLAAQWTAMRQHMIDEGTARLKALGQSDAQIAGNVALNELKAKNADDKVKVHQEYSKNMSENLLKHAQTSAAYGSANASNAEAEYHKALASGAITPYGGTTVNVNGGGFSPGSKADNAVMSKYVNPKRKEATEDAFRIQGLTNLQEKMKDPNLTYGDAKQSLLNAYQLGGGNPKGRLAVADVHEVLPYTQSWPDKLLSEILSGASNRVNPDFRKTVSGTIEGDLAIAKKSYSGKRETFRKNLGLPDAAADHYTNQIYPDIADAQTGATTRQVVPKSGQYKGKTVTIDGNNNILKVE